MLVKHCNALEHFVIGTGCKMFIFLTRSIELFSMWFDRNGPEYHYYVSIEVELSSWLNMALRLSETGVLLRLIV